MINDDLKIVHEANFEILKFFDQFCKDNNIKYCLDSGTLLGAIRHKDFIPWDDDIDVIMLREEYIRFEKAIKKLDNKYFEFISKEDYNDHFFDFVNRIAIIDSQRNIPTEEDIYYKNKNKLVLDIFTISNLPNNKLLSKLYVLEHKIIYGLAMGHRYSIDYENYSTIAKMQAFVLSNIGKIFTMKTINRWYDALVNKYNEIESTYGIVSDYSPDWHDLKYNIDWYTETQKGEIRNYEFSIPIGWDGVLSKTYGDYMKLPPEEQRVCGHLTNTEIKTGKLFEDR